MFTGIIETQGVVAALNPTAAGDMRLAITAAGWGPELYFGQSISVNGVCLTIAAWEGDTWEADVMPESMARTNLGDLAVGGAVNLERAMLAGGRFDGHVVQGHVDTTAKLVSRIPGERWEDFRFELPASLVPYVVEKGSITINGISLTVTTVTERDFGVSLIPTTLEITNLAALTVGDRVNLEADVLAKYVERQVQLAAKAEGSGK